MSRDVVTVRAQTPYRRIVDLMAQHHVSALPVLDEAGMVVGVVSEADLLFKIEHQERGEPGRRFPWRRRTGEVKAGGTVAADLMSTPALTINPAASIVTAAKLMDAERVKRLPVVTESGRLEGIVSRRDLLRVFLRTDRELCETVETEVVRRVLWATPEQVQVTVGSGVVTLTGTVERRSLVPIAERLTREVDGVVDVVCDLRYEMDDSDIRRPPRYADAWGPFD
jgi:CBS-domain-containing membrane protein